MLMDTKASFDEKVKKAIERLAAKEKEAQEKIARKLALVLV